MSETALSTLDLRPSAPALAVLHTLRALGGLGLGRAVVELAGRMGVTRPRDRFGDYRPRPEEIVVATYPKSGTNWMLQITEQLIGGGAIEFRHIHDRVPWPDTPPATRSLARLDDPIDPRTGRRVIKTHLPADHVPLVADATYILVVRDPCDVCVSAYHFLRGIIGGVMRFEPTPEQWVDHYLSPRCVIGSWAAHAASWWEACKAPGRHVFFYEDMKRDRAGAVRQVADAIGVALDDAVLDTVVERSGFAYMKAHESQFAPLAPVLRGDRAQMMRSGKSGAAGELLSAEQQRRIRDHFGAELARLGSDFPYGRYAG